MPASDFIHGITNAPGAAGGVASLRGPRGFSAYEIAVQEGFVGTVAEWLASLQGSGTGGPITAAGVTYNATYATVEAALDDLTYQPLGGAMGGLAVQLMGASVDEVNLTWSWNKAIVSQTLNGAVVPLADRAATIEGPFTNDTAFSVIGNDGTTSVTRAVTLAFSNDRFVGVGAAGLDAEAGAALTATARSANETRALTFTVTAGPGQKIYYLFPKRLGFPTFTVGGFEGGFDVSEEPLQNAAGFIEDFYICESQSANLGTTTVTAS